MKKNDNFINYTRVLFFFIILGLGIIIIFYHLIKLQIVGTTGKAAAQFDQMVSEELVTASRGNILDKNGTILVQDSLAKAVYLIPNNVRKGQEEALVEYLNLKLGIDKKELLEQITSLETDSVYLADNINQEVGEEVMGFGFAGIEYANKIVMCTPSEIKNAEVVAKELAIILELEKDKLFDLITSRDNNLLLVKSGVDNELANEIKEKNSVFSVFDEDGELESKNAIELLEDHRRYYTDGYFASHLLGFTNSEYLGITGVEAECDNILSGQAGVAYYFRDALGNTIPSQTRIIKQPKSGEDIQLSIDSNIQNIAEKEVGLAVQKWNAKSGTAIIMETKTGKILGMATSPDYDLNEPYRISKPFKESHSEDLKELTESEQLSLMWKNPAVSFYYEPGSTFKPITASAALEEGVVDPDTQVYCNGSINIDGTIIKCTGNHGTQTVTEAIANSCNPGLVTIIQQLEVQKFYQYAYNYGYGRETGVELGGEESGYLPQSLDSDGKINPLDYATMSFGQGLATTPIQNLTALNAVINNGFLIEPSVLKNSDSKLNINGEIGATNQIISETTSKVMREIMVNVITGNPTLSRISEGYDVGGKTGTAEKFINGAYSSEKYVTSFFCYAPVEDPKYSILMVLDEPADETTGGESVAPAALNIMKQILGPAYEKDEERLENSLMINPPDLIEQPLENAIKILENKGISYKIEGEGDFVVEQSLTPNKNYEIEEEIILTTGSRSGENNMVRVPDLTGQNIQLCNELLQGLGLQLKINNSGFVTKQSIEPGTLVAIGTEIQVEFEQ